MTAAQRRQGTGTAPGPIMRSEATVAGGRSSEATISSQQPERPTPQQVLNKLHTGVVVHAADTRVSYANLRAAELLGLSEAQMLGKTVIDPGWHFVDGLGHRVDPAQYPVSQVLASRQALKETDFGVIAPPRAVTNKQRPGRGALPPPQRRNTCGGARPPHVARHMGGVAPQVPALQ